jgi:hypothetical protein
MIFLIVTILISFIIYIIKSTKECRPLFDSLVKVVANGASTSPHNLRYYDCAPGRTSGARGRSMAEKAGSANQRWPYNLLPTVRCGVIVVRESTMTKKTGRTL